MLIDVVVPIHGASALTRRCVESVLATRGRMRQAFDLVLIDDSSTEAGMRDFLAELEGQAGIVLLRNVHNLGFVATANRGMALHPERDVVLLNSDTEVANDWLDRLHACAYREAGIGTVTPFSNNATICSFPVCCADNPLPPGMTVAGLDALFARVNAGRYLDLPTAVGFCMYIRRACLHAVGPFDEVRFGRGYGEENDFCRRAGAVGWRNVLAADTFVFHDGGVSFGAEREVLIARADATLAALHPDYFDAVKDFVRNDPAAPLRRSVEIEMARLRCVMRYPACAGSTDRATRLHVIHDMGGGSERWCRDFCRADVSEPNLVLKPFYSREMMIEGLMLFADPDATQPLRLWHFATPFETTAVHHVEYARVLGEVLSSYRIGTVLVSSLIGHALDVLETGLPTVWVGHDFFPLCPAIHLHYGGVCQACDDARLAECAKHNRDLNPFVGLSVEARLAIRHKVLGLLADGTVTLVAPTRTMQRHLETVFPSVAGANWAYIPHGVDTALMPLPMDVDGEGGRLRILVLGQLSVSKGAHLLKEVLERLEDEAEFHLVGTQEMGELFLDFPQTRVVKNYTVDALQDIVAGIRPHLGLLLSIWPETYSYTLTELMWMGVPPVTTRHGAFAERIIDGETGFMAEPRADAIVAKVRSLAADRAALAHVRVCLRGLPRRSVAAMVEDYRCLMPVGTIAAPPPDAAALETGEIMLRQAALLLPQRKRIKSLQLDADMRTERIHRLRLAIDAAESRWATREREFAAQMQVALADIAHLQGALDNENAEITKQKAYIDNLEAQLREIFSSTAWKFLAPLRALGKLRRRIGILKRSVWHIAAHPRSIPLYVKKAGKILRSEGLAGVKRAIVRTGTAAEQHDAWQSYRRTFEREVRSEILARIAKMRCRPLISILVPTFNTPEYMLREMLGSVAAQLYPNWELCIADDGSDQPHVRTILEQHAAADGRIKLACGHDNKGVSHASNVALGLASGNFVILLDHDDMLEEHALFRVAQAVCDDDPDMLYSDEVLVTEDGASAKQFVYRPAFSPEYLRGHPYIVHMVGFRKALLANIGGFDEQLRISQDYDLILRASEAARRIVHIPDILYRWRIHGGSAGHQKMGQVMATSSEILRRHLERCGEEGVVTEGGGFNLFDIRYPLLPDIRVAIIIPTRNHGDLLKQCIDSMRATVLTVRYDVIVIDHESDDENTLNYLDNLGAAAQVFRYKGEFNFSAINNWAVSKLSGDYSHFLFCNNDIQALSSGWLERMIEVGQRPGNAIVGARLLYPDRRTIQHAGVCVGAFGRAEHYGKFVHLPEDRIEPGYMGALVLNHEVSAVTAACMLVQAAAFRALGGFDESILVGFGDVDLCLRAGRFGYRVIYCAHAELIHHESYTRGISHQDNHPEDTARYLARWKTLLTTGDPYFNPGLSLDDTNWQVMQPLFCKYDIRRRVYEKTPASGMQTLFFSPGCPS